MRPHASDGYRALFALEEYTNGSGLSRTLLDLLRLRVSQINGCSYCVDMHASVLQEAGERAERIWAVAAWRDTPYFTAAERAALAFAEAATRIADHSGGVDDDVWRAVAEHYDEEHLAALVMVVASINAWNRINVSTRLSPGAWT